MIKKLNEKGIKNLRDNQIKLKISSNSNNKTKLELFYSDTSYTF